jgi:drug/metabolite transporter (DMT)-like permease
MTGRTWSGLGAPKQLTSDTVIQNKTHLAYCLLILTTLFWGANSVAGKMAVGEISPMLLTLARWVLAAGIVFAFGFADLKRDWPVIRRNIGLLIFYSVIGFTLFNVLLYTALTKTSAVNASIMQAAIPAAVYLLNFLYFRIKVTWWQIAGFGVTLLGVLIVATHGEIARLARLDLNTGDALVLIAVVSYAFYTIYLRYKPQMNWKSLITILAAIAAIATIPFVIWEWQNGSLIMPTNKGFWIILYTGIFPSILSQIFYIRGVELIGANRAGIFINLIPIFGTGLATLILGEPLQAFHMVALVLVIAGILLAERKAG